MVRTADTPGGVLERVGRVTYTRESSGPGYREYHELPGDAYRGLLHRYSRDERPGTGRFAGSVRGTGINTAGPGDHCGDAKLICRQQVHVNDVKPPTVPSCEARYQSAAAAMAEGRIK